MFRSTSLSYLSFFLTFCLSLCLSPSAFGQSCAQTPSLDDRDGYFVNLEETPQHPMERVSRPSGDELWVVNLSDTRISIFSLLTPAAPAFLTDLPVGLGPVSVRRRPNQDEVWVVCQSSNAVFVVDLTERFVKQVLRTPGEPVDLVFDDTDQFAYVSLSATHQIAEVDLETVDDPTKAAGIRIIEAEADPTPTSSDPAHIEEPRALRWSGGDLYVLSHKSGNGTVAEKPAAGGSFQVVDRWLTSAGGTTSDPPADRDVLLFNPAGPDQKGITVGWRMGTLNQDLLLAPNGDLLVSNVDLRNTRIGEFKLKELGFADHRISRRPPDGSLTPPTVIDLNAGLPASLETAGYSCSFPNEMALTPDGNTLFVACYETHNVAVVDLTTEAVIAELRPGMTPGPNDPFGPRGLVLDAAQNVLYVYFRGSNRLVTFDVAGLAPGDVRTATTSQQPVGFDITSAAIRRGRFQFIDAKNSGFGTGSCNTCHPDGHMDGIGWELGDFVGFGNVFEYDSATPLLNKQARDNKALKVTMSLRGIEETPPFHWRGDRADLEDFNSAFEGLLGGAMLSAPELRDLEAFVFSLSYPPNPRQALDRSYSATALAGFCNFTQVPSFEPFSGNDGSIVSLTCEQCHSLAGSAGTNNQVTNINAPSLMSPNSNNLGLILSPAQLRGLIDKESDPVLYSDGTTRPASGFGFRNQGAETQLADFFSSPGFVNLNPTERAEIFQFLLELDSGMAPTTAYAVTLTGSTPVAGEPDPQILLDGADGGHNDVVARGRLKNPPGIGAFIPVGMLYQPGSFPHLFTADRASLGSFTLDQLQTLVADGDADLTLVGTPLGSGNRLGLDRDLDGLMDGDDPNPAGLRTAPLESRSPEEWSSARTQPGPGTLPQPIAISNAQIRWVNSSVAKVEWQTDAPSKSYLKTLDSTGQVLWSRVEGRLKTSHVMVARKLQPGQPMTLRIESRATSSGGIAIVQKNLPTIPQDFLFDAVHIRSTTLDTSSSSTLGVSFEIVDNDGNLKDDIRVSFELVQWSAAGPNQVSGGFTQFSGSGTSPPGISEGSIGWDPTLETRVYVKAAGSSTTPEIYLHPLSGQFGFWAEHSP